MINSPDSDPNSGSYVGLLSRMTQRVEQIHIDDKILKLMHQVFEDELSKEDIVISSTEKGRLFRQVSGAVLTDLLGSLESPK